jgi:hypothetical protein
MRQRCRCPATHEAACTATTPVEIDRQPVGLFVRNVQGSQELLADFCVPPLIPPAPGGGGGGLEPDAYPSLLSNPPERRPVVGPCAFGPGAAAHQAPHAQGPPARPRTRCLPPRPRTEARPAPARGPRRTKPRPAMPAHARGPRRQHARGPARRTRPATDTSARLRTGTSIARRPAHEGPAIARRPAPRPAVGRSQRAAEPPAPVGPSPLTGATHRRTGVRVGVLAAGLGAATPAAGRTSTPAASKAIHVSSYR